MANTKGDEHVFLGRREVLTDATEITSKQQLIDELNRALYVHRQNKAEIQYLWNYYRGLQDIQKKVKIVRPEINHKVTVNKASQIVDFKEDFVIGDPVTYITRSDEQSVMDAVNKMNDAFYALDKFPQDKELIKWGLICGIANRYISTEKVDDVPFNICTLDPRDSFVVKNSGIGKKPVFAVSYYEKVGGASGAPVTGVNIYNSEVYEVWTVNKFYRVEDGKVVESGDNNLGMIPIIEYPANKERQGCFEKVLPLLNALNDVFSGRMDGLDNYVQSFLKFINCEIDEAGMEMLRAYGAIKIKSEKDLPADVQFIGTELNQQQTQTLASDIEMEIITICGLPNRNGGSSTSDTGRGVELRDGWSDALCRAKATEDAYKESDKKAMRVILKICSMDNFVELKVSDIEAKFSMHNYDNIQSKSQVLIAMLQNNMIHPKLAFEASGLFIDPESAYKISMEWHKEQEEKALEQQKMLLAQQAKTADKADSNNEQRSSKNADGKEISNPISKEASKENS